MVMVNGQEDDPGGLADGDGGQGIGGKKQSLNGNHFWSVFADDITDAGVDEFQALPAGEIFVCLYQAKVDKYEFIGSVGFDDAEAGCGRAGIDAQYLH